MDESNKTPGEELAELHGDPERNVVLCVDDERNYLRTLSRIVSRALPGYTVESVEVNEDVIRGFDSIEEAFARIFSEFSERIALILSDIEMLPWGTGIDLAKAPRSEGMEKIPFVLNSGNSNYGVPGCEKGDIMQALIDEGFVDAFVDKGSKVDKLQKTFSEAIARVKARIAEEGQKSE